MSFTGGKQTLTMNYEVALLNVGEVHVQKSKKITASCHHNQFLEDDLFSSQSCKLTDGPQWDP